MLKNIIKGQYHHSTDYMYEFTDEYGCGFAFPCDLDGNIFISDLSPEAFDNLSACMAHITDFYFHGIREYDNDYHEPDRGICVCGAEVYLDRDNSYLAAVQCPKCGKWYNLFGQELLPPDEWDYGYDD